MTLKEHVEVVKAEGVKCNCDLDKWQPEPNTGHSFVCHIHKEALTRYRADKNNKFRKAYGG